MRHYIPWATATGYAVVYQNHRGEFVSVMECGTLKSAYAESQRMTLEATKLALAAL